MHICQDEIIAASLSLPFIRYGGPWLIAKLKEKCGIGCKHSDDVHDCGDCEVDFECEAQEEGKP